VENSRLPIANPSIPGFGLGMSTGDHIERHEIDLYLDAVSAVCFRRIGDNLLGLQCDTIDRDGEPIRVLVSFEGEAAPKLKRAVDRIFDQHPEMRTWK
jgi:hypothetical protein